MGCWKAFLEAGWSFGAVAGSSIGSLNAALICQGDWDRAHALWTELADMPVPWPDLKKMGKLAANAALDLGLLLLPVPNIRAVKILKYAAAAVKAGSRHGFLGGLLKDGLLDLASLKPFLGRFLDMKKVLAGNTDLYVTVWDSSGVPGTARSARWFRLQDLTEDRAWQMLAASMSLPLVFSATELDGRLFRDGGIGLWLPVQPLYETGSRRIATISTKPSPGIEPTRYPGAQIVSVHPEKSLGPFPISTFMFTRQAVEEWIELGYKDASLILR